MSSRILSASVFLITLACDAKDDSGAATPRADTGDAGIDSGLEGSDGGVGNGGGDGGRGGAGGVGGGRPAPTPATSVNASASMLGLRGSQSLGLEIRQNFAEMFRSTPAPRCAQKKCTSTFGYRTAESRKKREFHLFKYWFR